MQSRIYWLAGMSLLMLGACDKAKSPDTAANDIAAAHQVAAKEVAEARQDLQKDINSDAYEVAVARADGEHKVAIQKCDVLQGHDQKTCKDQADADYEAAKANAKAAKAAQQP